MATTRILLAAALLAPLLWIFGEAIFTPRSFVFRDAGHYYDPLFQWAAREWGAGRIPLWNPYENCGTPALADPTTSVFYPGKLVFGLPLDYATRYKAYILAHVLLAGGTAYFTARRWRASPAAATACGLSYAYGGSVVFQYCNVVYLVGAAWLPLALWTAEGLLRRRRWSWAAGLGAVLAMMVLGGDPQTAYHAGLAALLGLAVWRRRCGARSAESKEPETPSRALARAVASHDAALRPPTAPAAPSAPSRWAWMLRHRLTLLAGAALIAAFLAAVQVLPAREWTQRSERAVFDAPRTLYEIPPWLSRSHGSKEQKTGAAALFHLVRPPAAGTHHNHLYQFSVGPWRWAEFVWPNFSGRMFPIHRRWTAVIPAEERVWTPSLYIGLAPLIAALAAWRLRGGPRRTRWLSWMALLALLAALGWYGLGWLWIELRFALWGADPQTAAVGAPTGGLYWLLVNALPGYVYFRYPAKWLTVASLALSLLAAQGWDVVFSGRSLRARRLTTATLILSLMGMAVWFAVRPFWNGWMEAATPDDLLGPLDADGAARDLLFAFLHAALLAGMFQVAAASLRRPNSQTQPATPGHGGGTPPLRSRLATWAVLVTAIDLSLAHGWLAPTAPREIWKQTPPGAAVIAADAASQGLPPGPRVFRAAQARWLPERWRESSSGHRQIEGLRWDRASLYPKHHLPSKILLVASNGSMTAADYQALLAVAREFGLRRPDGVREPAPEVLSLLGAQYLLLPRGAALEGGRPVAACLGPGDLANVTAWRNPSALPRAWIVHRVEWLPERTDDSPAALVRRTQEVLRRRDQWRDFRTEAVVEAPPAPETPSSRDLGALASSLASPICRLVTDEPQRIEVDVELSAPGLLVMSDLYDADWRAAYLADGETAVRPLPLLRTNRVLRGVWLPAGRGRVTFVYRPTAFYLGAAISAAAWFALGAILAQRKFRRSGRDSNSVPG